MPLTSLVPLRPEAAPGPWPGLEMLATAVLLLSEERVVRYANPAAEHLFELSRSRFTGNAIGALFTDARLLAGAIDNAVATGSTYTEQELELGVAGKQRAHLTVTVTPVEHEDVALVLEFRHIDQQLKIAREERQLEQQQANRELIRNLAHEIKNPLGGIRGAAQLLERELDRPQLSEYTQVIIHEADRLQSLVNRLLTPHRIPSYRRTNIHEILVRVKGVVQAEFPAIPIDADFDISLPDIEADPEQLMQAVLNVVRNAAEALEDRIAAGDARIILRTRVARQATIARTRHRLALDLHIIDNGPGIPDELKDRVFFPLVSGRDTGTGLGLTLAQTFVQQHDGLIEVESRPGRTDFRILIPLQRAHDT